MKTTIYFDMDGTIADLYGVENWLDCLLNEDTFPYANAQPLLRLSALAKRLNNLQRQGYNIGIISWLSKSGSDAYNADVTAVKAQWLTRRMPSVNWDEVHIIPYGTPKENYCKSPLDILFDDEQRNRDNWTGRAFDVDNILGTLASLNCWMDEVMSL